MTSSFTNLVLAAHSLAGQDERYLESAARLWPPRPALFSRSARETSRPSRAARYSAGRLSGQRLPAGRRSRIGAQDAGDERRPRADDRRVLPRAAPRSDVPRSATDSLVVALPLLRPGRPRVRAGPRSRELDRKKLGARGGCSSANGVPPDLAGESEDVLIDVERRGRPLDDGRAEPPGRRGGPAPRLLPLPSRRRPPRPPSDGRDPARRRRLRDPRR